MGVSPPTAFSCAADDRAAGPPPAAATHVDGAPLVRRSKGVSIRRRKARTPSHRAQTWAARRNAPSKSPRRRLDFPQPEYDHSFIERANAHCKNDGHRATKRRRPKQRRAPYSSRRHPMNTPSGAGTNVILHIGAGSFHRAHQAWYLHRLNEASGPDEPQWSLTVGNIRGDMTAVLDALAAQHGVYTLETVTPQGERAYEAIRSIKRVVPWSQSLAELVETGADPACKIVSFTVTEGGYYLDEHDRLDTTNPDLAADLAGARTTIYGALAAILEARMQRNAGPVTLQSCDNLRSNGERFHAGMRAFLQQSGHAALLTWFDANTACPNSMVYRITPRPTDDVRDRVLAATGFDDACPVMGEAFIQWVIEDRFCAGRPAWERVGAEL